MNGRAELALRFAGPHVSVQDAGRPGFLRYGVPASGPMDRLALAAANLALGNPAGAAGIEVSPGGLVLECLSGAVGFAVAGGGFIVDHAGHRGGGWRTATLRSGQGLAIRSGPWGSWCILALAGRMEVAHWLGSAATHAASGFGGGLLKAGMRLVVDETRCPAPRAIPFPVFARPRGALRVTLGPQERFFEPEAVAAFLAGPWRMTDARDRMGVRLAGPPIPPRGALDTPSEPVARGSVQVAGDGVATVLLADHQPTGGYPKIATVLDCDLDAFVQSRPGDLLRFRPVSATEAVDLARIHAATQYRYLEALRRARQST
ncbi:MAG: biotin-dependent carboxyltransferase family protein [Gemmobacter sp.]|jgi:allophanate hydrolase|nr:biotin-dependent carboxyltransferase family protein [Gemmobacter sp.]